MSFPGFRDGLAVLIMPPLLAAVGASFRSWLGCGSPAIYSGVVVPGLDPFEDRARELPLGSPGPLVEQFQLQSAE